MDRETDRVFVDYGREPIGVLNFLNVFTRAKGLRISPLANPALHDPELVTRFRGIITMGFWPTILFIQDIRRYPELDADTPEKRALVNTYTQQVVYGHTSILDLAPCFARMSPTHPFLNEGYTPCILDIAVASAPVITGTPWAYQLRVNLWAYIRARNCDQEVLS